MRNPAVPLALAGMLAAGPGGAARAMTPEQVRQTLALATDATAMWAALPTLAAEPRATAGLIRDLEALVDLPECPQARIPADARRHAAAAVAWLRERLPGQYQAWARNPRLKAWAPPAQAAAPAPIPRTIHFIWLGSPVPAAYLANIRAIAALNGDYQVHLWVDEASRDSAGALPASRFRVRPVDQALAESVAPEEARAIHRLAVSPAGGRPNYAAASDILRMLILHAEGGVYLDTDTCVPQPESACGFGQLKAKYGFLASTQTRHRDDAFNNSPMAAAAGAPVLGELLALAGKRYRDAARADQPAAGKGPDGQPWLHWLTAGGREDLRLASTVFLAGPVLVADYLTRIGLGWLQARGAEPDGPIPAGPPEVEGFPPDPGKTSCRAAGPVPAAADYYFLDSILADFDLTVEAYGLSHQFHHSWLAPKAPGGPAETKGERPAGT